MSACSGGLAFLFVLCRGQWSSSLRLCYLRILCFWRLCVPISCRRGFSERHDCFLLVLRTLVSVTFDPYRIGRTAKEREITFQAAHDLFNDRLKGKKNEEAILLP